MKEKKHLLGWEYSSLIECLSGLGEALGSILRTNKENVSVSTYLFTDVNSGVCVSVYVCVLVSSI